MPARKTVLLMGPTSPVAEAILGDEADLVRADELGDAAVARVLPDVEAVYTHAPAVLPGEAIRAARRLEVIGSNRDGDEWHDEFWNRSSISRVLKFGV